LVSLAGVKIEDENSYRKAIEKVMEISEEKDTSGGEINLIVSGIPTGLGAPVFYKLDALLAGALMGIGGIKAVEIGLGKKSACKRGSEMNDNFSDKSLEEFRKTKVNFNSNNSGGILAGISTGSDLLIKLSIKPTPTIGKTQQGLNTNLKTQPIKMKGRHDKNITPRVAKIAEAMVSLVILDQLLLNGIINRDILI